MLRIYIYPMVVILYIVATLIPNTYVLYLVGIFANLSVLISIFYARGIYLYSGIFFYSAAFILFLRSDLSWNSFLLHFDSMLGILALFLLLPFLSSLISVGRYDKQLSNLMKYNISHVGDLYKRGTFTTYLLGLFLNMATIPIVLQSLRESFKPFSKIFTDKFYTRALLRSYALCLMWSPMEILIIQSIAMTQTDYLMLLPFLLFFSFMLLLIDISVGRRRYSRIAVTATDSTVSFQSIISNIRELFTLLLVLIVAVTILNYILDKGYLFSLVLLIIPISFLWSLKLRKVKRYLIHSIPLWSIRTKGLANYFFMFLSAGFFVNMIAGTKMIEYIQNIFIQYHEQTFILYSLIGVYFFIIALLGFHPLVSIVLLAEILNPLLPIIASVPLAVLLVITSLSSVSYSPFNVSISILSNEIKRNPVQVGSWNVLFALFLIIMAIAFSYSMHVISLFLF